MGWDKVINNLAKQQFLNPEDPRVLVHVSPEVIHRESRYVPGLGFVGPFMKLMRNKMDTLPPGNYGYYGTIAADKPELPLRSLKGKTINKMVKGLKGKMVEESKKLVEPKDIKFWASRGYRKGF
jgi:hypothetical protein